MTHLPFKQSRVSTETREVILLDRKYEPHWGAVAFIWLTAGALTFIARFQQSGHVVASIWEAFVVLALGTAVSRPIYYLLSSQLWVPTTLLANSDWVRGYLQQPGPWLNFLAETPVQLAWGQVRQARISHRPWVFAEDKVELDLTLRDATDLTFRLPRLVGDEREKLAEVLRAIGTKYGFPVEFMPANQTPRLWRRWGW